MLILTLIEKEGNSEEGMSEQTSIGIFSYILRNMLRKNSKKVYLEAFRLNVFSDVFLTTVTFSKHMIVISSLNLYDFIFIYG